MEEAWDEVTWHDDNELKEWYVEYVAQVNDEKIHHMSILYGVDVQDVQKSLLHEIRRNYRGTDRIDVTIIKMKETNTSPDSAVFEGAFTP